MKRYRLKIELLSDLCVSDGGVYNSTLDTDICHDIYGFPFIPAKRIKGCLRECALELKDWGMNISPEAVFGGPGSGDNRAKVRIGDAVLEMPGGLTYDDMVRQVEENKDHPIFHPLNILNLFSYVRTQTAVDNETGTADPHSLRTIRVADKGLVFVSEVELEDGVDPDAFRACCDTLTNMGMGRTRGLGEVRTTLEEPACTGTESEHAELVPGADRLSYTLYLEEPMICKSVDGGETRTLDYIEGSKILGLVVGEMKKRGKDYTAINDGGRLFFSNAYPEKDGKRCLEVPADYHSVKNNREKYLEMGRPDDKPTDMGEIQDSPMRHCYAQKDNMGRLSVTEVETEERYHHRRPADKSIGRVNKSDDQADQSDGSADKSENGEFYQISSIAAGQTFCGYVTGTEEQIRAVHECMEKLDTVFLGYSHSAEYGKTRIRVEKTEKVKRKPVKETQNFYVKLEAPVLIYNDRAFYSTDVRDLDLEVRTAMGLQDLGEEDFRLDRYVNYTTVGGYNVTWKKRKPTTAVFDKGTVLHYHLLNQKVQIPEETTMLIGERVSEGFGEVTLAVPDGNRITRETDATSSKFEEDWHTVASDLAVSEEVKKICEIQVTPGTLAESISKKLFREYMGIHAVKAARSRTDYGDSTKATISNMFLMCKDSKNRSPAGVKADVEDRYSNNQGKKQEANRILKDASEGLKNVYDDFRTEYRVTWDAVQAVQWDQWDESEEKDETEEEKEADKLKLEYLQAYLVQLKYNIRAREARKPKGGESA